MNEVTPNLRVTIDCPDGCGRHGTPLRNGHVRGCKDSGCRSCLGRSSRAKGKTKERAVRKRLGITTVSKAAASVGEEAWDWCFDVEAKAGAQVGPIATRFLLAEKQSQAPKNQVVGRLRPFLMAAMPDGWGSDGIVLMRLSTFERHIAPLIEEAGGTAA